MEEKEKEMKILKKELYELKSNIHNNTMRVDASNKSY
jgi:hypothetical protein